MSRRGRAIEADPGAPGLAGAGAETERPRLAHVPALDGLRGLAVVAVILFHAGYLTGGWLGVDLFFVLSGYLITSLLLVEHRATGHIDAGAFWGRRARRILPALLVVVVAVAIYAHVAFDPADLGRARTDGLATLFFAANWHDILHGASYWDRTLSPSPFAHAWSLAVEEQLYVLWPLVLGLVVRRARRRGRRSRARPPEVVARFALAVAAASAALALGLYAAGASQDRIYFGTDTRAVAVALGAFVAAWRMRRGGVPPVTARRLEAVALVAAVVLGVAWWGLDGSSAFTYRGGLVGASVLGAVVVAAAADRRGGLLTTVLSVRPLRALGTISYGLYLWHWPIDVALAEPHVHLQGVALLALRLAATLAAAVASWSLVERPIRTGHPIGWWAGRRGWSSAVGAVALATIALLVGTLGAASLPTADLATGVVGAKGAAAYPKVVVLGDSVAASIAAPAIREPRSFGLDVVRDTVLGCQAVWDGVHRARGTEGNVNRPPACPPGVGRLVQAERPAAVLLLYGGWTDADFEIDGAWHGACDAPYEAALATRFTQLLAQARASGAPVVVSNAARSTNTFRHADNWARTACVNTVMEAVAHQTTGVQVLDLDGWLCPHAHCHDELQGLPVRSDGVHFQGPGGDLAAHWVLSRVAALAGIAAHGTSGGSMHEHDLATICRSYAQLRNFMSPDLPTILHSPTARQAFEDGVAAFRPSTLRGLDPAVAADLQPLATPAFQAFVKQEIRGLLAGKPIALDALPPDVVRGLQPAMDRLKTTC